MHDQIEEKILRFHDKIQTDPNHRFRSWDHCYAHFRQRTAMSSEQHTDLAALNLAFYLASWGMYRGSSSLLWKDYKIHLSAVATIHSQQFAPLWELRLAGASDAAATAELVLTLSNALKTVYRELITTVDGQLKQYMPTDTLITKILLGTIGCTPACDRYFISGFQSAGLSYSRFDSLFLRRVFEYYRDNRDSFESARQLIRDRGGIEYPAMKLTDMYFWTLGWEILSAAGADEL